jgi:hypothetical protein
MNNYKFKSHVKDNLIFLNNQLVSKLVIFYSNLWWDFSHSDKDQRRLSFKRKYIDDSSKFYWFT